MDKSLEVEVYKQKGYANVGRKLIHTDRSM